jgi:hypothetical protein
MLDPRYQVKQWIGVVKGDHPTIRWAVMETGDSRYYLFRVVENGCMGDLCFPVLKKNLRDDIRRALAHGVGNAGMRPGDDGKVFRSLPPGHVWKTTSVFDPATGMVYYHSVGHDPLHPRRMPFDCHLMRLHAQRNRDADDLPG